MILADGMLGQMMEPIAFPEHSQTAPIPKPWATNGHGNKRPHNIINSLYLQPDELEKTVIERYKRYDIIKEKEPLAEEYLTEEAEVLVVAYGATSRIARSAINRARAEGIRAGMVRPLTLWPFPAKQIADCAKNAKHLLCVEMSMGQMIDDVKLAISCSKPVSFFGHTGGIIPTPDEIYNQIRSICGGDK